MRTLRRKLLVAAVAAVLAVICAIVWAFDPESGTFPFPKCPVKWLTGWDCPGCGATRALHAALHGDFAAALEFNAAMPVGLLLIMVVSITESFGSNRLRQIVLSPYAAGLILVMALAWTVYRNL